jgi:hypothetical protein
VQSAQGAGGINTAVLDQFTADCVQQVVTVLRDLLAEFV